MKRTTASVALVAMGTMAGTANAEFALELLGTVNVDVTSDPTQPSFIGNNPSAVAWNGTDLWVAGFNQSGVNADTGIVKISDALGAQTFGSTFGALDTPTGRGFSGLDMKDGVLAAAWDDGAEDANGIRAFAGSDGSELWAQSARGGSGVAHDPGFKGVDSGVAWTQFGSGRRALNDSTTGEVIYDLTNGMIINDAGQGTFWRDMDFAPNGDIVLREGNNLGMLTRTGGNSLTDGMVLFDSDPEADFVNGQNVSYMSTGFGDFIIFNDRKVTDPDQSPDDVLKLYDVASDTMLDLTGIEGLADLGNGYYDFDFHAPSGTLAIMDFANRDVAIYAVVPAPGAATLLGAGGLLALRRRR